MMWVHKKWPIGTRVKERRWPEAHGVIVKPDKGEETPWTLDAERTGVSFWHIVVFEQGARMAMSQAMLEPDMTEFEIMALEAQLK